jgi:energy-coupling factor transporter ATP-binding protein EcfA2
VSFNITLPNRNGTNVSEQLETSNNLVIIGANGAGKTRLGIWIEEQIQNQVTVHRISAQKALSIPEFAQIKNLEQAEKELFWGRSDQHGSVARKVHDRWGSKPATSLLNDYDKLLSLLFAKDSERDKVHAQDTKQQQTYIPVPDSPIDVIVNIWKEIMPHREIRFADGKVMVKKEDEADYHGMEMSDGERVTLYLIGQCLCAPSNSVIIIDEPEIHLHKSLVYKLWNKIEKIVGEKLFIYITHDLDFASSRNDAHKYWIKSYKGNSSWEWDEVPVDENLPDSLVLEIVGNRKNVIFCEGDNGSLDTTIYQLYYPEYHIIPRGSCTKVIDAAKAIRDNTEIHHVNAFGIIDSDYRDEDEVTSLESHGIYTISVAEVENLFCIEPLIRLVSTHLGLDPDENVENVIDFLISALQGELDVQISSKAERRIQYLLGAYSKEGNSIQGLEDAIATTLRRIDVPTIYSESKALFNSAISERCLESILLNYNRKNLQNRISSIFGLANGEYEKLLVRLMKSEKQDEILIALEQYLPNLSVQVT